MVQSRMMLARKSVPTYRPESTDREVLEEVVSLNVYLPPFVVSYVPRGGIVIDLGAHIGAFSYMAARLLRPSQIIAVEPHPENLQLLQSNARAISDLTTVRIVRAAAWSHNGCGRLTDARDSAARHCVLRESDVVGTGAASRNAVRMVRLVSVDDLVEQLKVSNGATSLIKLDVQGSELEALAGMVNTLARVPVVVGELHTAQASEHQLRAALPKFHVVMGTDLNGRLSTRMFVAVSRRLIKPEAATELSLAAQVHYAWTVVMTIRTRIVELSDAIAVDTESGAGAPSPELSGEYDRFDALLTLLEAAELEFAEARRVAVQTARRRH